MPLAEDFQEIVDSLPSDWTDLELDLRVDESRYIDAATLVVQVNAQPYSHHDWHWRILVAHQFGHAAAAPTVHGTLALLDDGRDPRRAGAARAAHAGAWRRCRCGAAASPCARSSAASARSSGARRRRLRRPAARLQRARDADARPATRRGWRGAQVVGRRRRRPRRRPRQRGLRRRRRWSSACARPESSGGTRTLGVYSHVHHDVKLRAEAAGFDLVVPRSRMAREGAALVERLAG